MIEFQWIQKVAIDHHREFGYLSNVTADMSSKVYYSISQKNKLIGTPTRCGIWCPQQTYLVKAEVIALKNLIYAWTMLIDWVSGASRMLRCSVEMFLSQNKDHHV